MRVTGPQGPTSAQPGPKARGAGEGGFRLPSAQASAGAGQAAPAQAAAGVSGLAALLALQDVGDPLERRRRAVTRAGRILDSLDEVKLALLDGTLPPESLLRLRAAVREERAGSDDPALQAVLDEVELRAAVELAKLDRAGRAA